ncbi:uncharacterized protein BDR25DRAFT_372326 [Lindgomyces ingoldianus]|uniref:Integral membrane protein n=1 Tax=Lindgomyces ingoldianus TaxID=673940 RepID=A0ACB6QQJ4_9PLEO|nr:uncharacterized protein BDR25DRAFT_372326 [Lindgomyces ingoldianus]KAF2469127.1 integral membrane protein [Lindgomyces ingoldianus]
MDHARHRPIDHDPEDNVKDSSRECSRNDENLPLLQKRVPNVGLNSSRSVSIIICVSATTLIGCMLSGMVTIATPQIGADLNLGADKILWPVSMYHLASGCTLLIAGSLSDVIGCKTVFLAGCFLQMIFSTACGLSRTDDELITARIFSGLATSLCLPSAVGLITQSFPHGPMRNLAFSFMGGGQPIGFGVGLTLGGILVDTLGWQWGFHFVAISNAIVLMLAWYTLPPKPSDAPPLSWNRLLSDIDWVGAFLISSSMLLLSYYLSVITENTSQMVEGANVAMLCVSIVLGATFFFWVDFQTRRGQPVLVPNVLWQSKRFTSICINVFLIWGAFNAFEQVANFVFQDVQGLSALTSAFQFLPVALSGSVTSIITGLLLHKVRADYLMYITIALSTFSPLLMAIADPGWSYWTAAFPAVFLNSIGADSLFTTSNLVISSMFPLEMQGLAGGVFNTVSQIGKSMGLAVVALIGNTVTQHSKYEDKKGLEALMAGYRVCFWVLFWCYVTSIAVTVFGFHRIGIIGHARKNTL